jgi:N6-L-threonylcarbamoyladenine synthase
VESLARIELLGQTRDDAAGEAFDKVAKRLGLAYPGGREVDRVAREGRARAVPFPRPLLGEAGLDFSFSGLKTSVALEIERRERERGGELPPADVADIAASFQEAVVDVLVEKILRAHARTGCPRFAVVGGLAANRRLRERTAEVARTHRLEIHFPPVRLCTDNAAMIAAVADRMLADGARAPLSLDAFSRVPLGLSG